jgi:hypothetical protein
VTFPPEVVGDEAAEPAAEEVAAVEAADALADVVEFAEVAGVPLDLVELQPAASARPDAATTPRRRFRGRTVFLQFV